MNAIILAAGCGSRLRPLTEKKPKTMVEVNGKPIIGHAINRLIHEGITQIAICTGYHSDIIREYCERDFRLVDFRFIENSEYLTTNNMFSLYLAREYLVEDCVVMNGDVVFDAGIVSLLLNQDHTAFAVDAGKYLDESMKVAVQNGRIVAISKNIPQQEAFGCSIDIYKIASSDTSLLIEEMQRIIEIENNKTNWTEVLLNRLCADGRLVAHPAAIGERRWYEIDNFDDLTAAESIFNTRWNDFITRKIFFLDRDGTLTLSGKPLPGAAQLIEWLKVSGKRCYVLTNNSSKTPSQHLSALRRCGFNLCSENVLLSTDVAAEYLVRQGLKKVYWIASDEVATYLQEAYELEFETQTPAAVLLTYDETLDYEKLLGATRHLRQEVRYFATHRDVVCPTEDGPVPDIGTFIEVLRLTTGRVPELTFGKPSRAMVEPTLERLGLNYGDAVVIGDRLYTDLELARGTDMLSVLVLTGETTRASYESQKFRADIVASDLQQLLARAIIA